MHIHASAMSFLALSLQLIIFGFLWRALTMRLLADKDSTIGKAMAFIY